jgi:LPS export ABC transporter protein LptC
MRDPRKRALLAGALLGLAGCGGRDVPSDAGNEGSTLEREVRGFTLVETVEGRAHWELRAERAWRLPGRDDVQLNAVHVRFFDEEGEVSSVLTSHRGSVNEETEALTAQGNVVLISTRGDTLTTEEVHYDKEEDLLRGPGAVRMARVDRVLTGTTFEATPDLTHYEVEKDVHIIVRGSDDVVGDGP